MLIYILLFITVALPAFLISPQNQEKRKNIITFYAVVVFATLTCGLRDMLGGYDSYIYGDIFEMFLRMDPIKLFEHTAFYIFHIDKPVLISVGTVHFCRNTGAETLNGNGKKFKRTLIGYPIKFFP